MNLILNEKNLSLNNISLSNKKTKYKIFYKIDNIKINGIPLLVSKNNISYKNVNNYEIKEIIFNENDILFIKLKLIDNHFKKLINNYKSFIKNNSIKIKINKDISNNLYFVISNIKLINNIYYVNIFQI